MHPHTRANSGQFEGARGQEASRGQLLNVLLANEDADAAGSSWPAERRPGEATFLRLAPWKQETGPFEAGASANLGQGKRMGRREEHAI